MVKFFRDKIATYFNMDMPSTATWSGWKVIEKEARAKYPVRWFISRSIPGAWFKCVTKPWAAAKCWVDHRTVSRYHIIKINSLKPGYYDLDTRLLHGVFALLVDYVELECALMHGKHDDTPWRFLRLKQRRDAKAGLAYLLAMSTPEPDEPQAPYHDAASVAIELYDWWVNKRPERVRPHIASGLHALYVADDGCFDDMAKRPYFLATLDKYNEIERQYEAEDTAQMVRLISIRRHLWT